MKKAVKRKLEKEDFHKKEVIDVFSYFNPITGKLPIVYPIHFQWVADSARMLVNKKRKLCDYYIAADYIYQLVTKGKDSYMSSQSPEMGYMETTFLSDTMALQEAKKICSIEKLSQQLKGITWAELFGIHALMKTGECRALRDIGVTKDSPTNQLDKESITVDLLFEAVQSVYVGEACFKEEQINTIQRGSLASLTGGIQQNKAASKRHITTEQMVESYIEYYLINYQDYSKYSDVLQAFLDCSDPEIGDHEKMLTDRLRLFLNKNPSYEIKKS
ncbi:MAG: hypothetical protein AB2687_08215 [Candidatus Thiodiazotropha taylori]